jgi:hypothetical protein
MASWTSSDACAGTLSDAVLQENSASPNSPGGETVASSTGVPSAPWLDRLRSPLRDAAFVLAALTAVLYVAGHSYLTSYYSRFGVSETELHFDLPYTLMASFAPLLYPVFFTIAAACLCMIISQGFEQRIPSPFHPIPGVQVFLLVFGLWSFRLVSELASPAAPVTWFIWNRRALLYFMVGCAIFMVLLVRNWKAHGVQRPGRLRAATWAQILWLAAAYGLAGWNYVRNHEWPFGEFENAFLVMGPFLIALQIVLDFRSWPARKWGPYEFGRGKPRRLGKTIYLGTATSVLILLAAGLSGVVDGTQVVRGCEPLRTIRFEPAQFEIPNNVTMGVILHANGYYYVHEIQPWKNDTLLIPERNDVRVVLGFAPATKGCA